MLAARGKHRTSTDIDIKVHDIFALARYTPRGGHAQELDCDMKTLGGERATEEFTENQIIYRFASGIVDLSAGVPLAWEEGTETTVEGIEVHVAENEQILFMKLFGRRGRREVVVDRPI